MPESSPLRDAEPRSEEGAASELLPYLCECAAAWQQAERWEDFDAPVARVEAASAGAGVPILHEVCALLRERLHELGVAGASPSEEQRAWLQAWPLLAAAWVKSPWDLATGAGLVAFLHDERWPTPLPAAHLDALRLRLGEAAQAPEEGIDVALVSLAPEPADVADDWSVRLPPAVPDPEDSPDGFDVSITSFAAAEPLAARGHDEPAALPEPGADALVDDAAHETVHEESLDRMLGRQGAAAGQEAWGAPAPEAPPGGGPRAELPDAIREMVDLLVLEVDFLKTSLTDVAHLAAGEGTPAEETREAMMHFAEELERFVGASEVAGLDGLGRAAAHVHMNVLELSANPGALDGARVALLESWCSATLGYLHRLGDADNATAYAASLADAGWPFPAPEDLVEDLARELATPVSEIPLEEHDPRQTTASPEDVSLDLPQDVDAEVLDGMLQDLPGQTSEFSAAVQRLRAGGTAADLEVAQRIAHTVKGAANTVGVPGIANLTHQLEDILLALTKHASLPGPALADMLTDAADCLEAMSEALLGQAPAPAESLAMLQHVLDWANRIDREGVEAVNTAASEAHAQAHAPAPQSTVEEAPLAGSVSAGGAATMRVSAGLVDELLRLVGETIILTGQVQERILGGVRQMRSMREQLASVHQLAAEMEQLIDLQDVSLPRMRAANGADFDPLELDQYNELHSASRRLIEAATDATEIGRGIEEHFGALGDMLVEQGRLNRESQEAVMRTRMVGVHTIVPRVQRSVRQAARLSGKQVELECVGTDTQVDSDVLAGLVDPLMHLLRNAVDHGIEPEHERVAAGKAPVGCVRLEFHREGNNILVRCCDDGRGLDWDAIVAAARLRGLLEADRSPSRDELTQLVLRPSFSTRAEATQLSGRGIGLDVVHTAVVRLGGSLRIDSEAGKGCQIEFRLPLTLVSTHALLVRTAKQVVAVSNRGVEQILHPESGALARIGDRPAYRFGESVYPVTALAQLLGLADERRVPRDAAAPVLLVQGETGLQAVIVDAVLDSRDLVIKGLGRYLPELRGIAGATILGDGTVTPVIDLPELLRAPALATRAAAAHAEDETGVVESELPCALVVDDSLSARRSLAQFMSDSGFQVRTARDGLEAIQVINARRPNILLVDLEMPRMNGLELTAHVRANHATRDLPVIMITSRSTEKHRSQARSAGVDEYLVKPFAEDELIERVYALCGAA